MWSDGTLIVAIGNASVIWSARKTVQYFLIKLNFYLTNNLAILFLDIHQREMKIISQWLYSNRQKLETTQNVLRVNGNKLWSIYLYSEILVIKKKRTVHTHNNMDESQMPYAKRKKPDLKDNILQKSAYMTFQRRQN